MLAITLNDKPLKIQVDPDTPLLWVLRDKFGLKGTKYGCGMGVCGICLVHVDGKPVRSCVTSVADVHNKSVVTIEGLERDHSVLRAWIEEQVPQCGYCQPGQVMAAVALLNRSPQPSDYDISTAMSEVLCRCGTYARIKRAIKKVLKHASSDVESKRLSSSIKHSVYDSVSNDPQDVFAPNPWIRLRRDGTTTLVIDRSEMGQGVVTGLTMLIAEEMEISLDNVRFNFAPADKKYFNTIIGEQLTGGSTSIRSAWETLRLAGAQAREALIAAAAELWNVKCTACRAKRGEVIHIPTGRRLAYGELVDRARTLPIPKKVQLKKHDEFELIGRSLPRLEITDMVLGRAVYGLDVSLPHMKVATVERCPFIGGNLAKFEARKALKVEGVRDVIAISSGVAVIADNIYTALKGRQVLEVYWNTNSKNVLSSEKILEQFINASYGKGHPERDDGDTKRALARAPRTFMQVYETPYLAHACMEPMNCTARVSTSGCDIWVGTQAQTATHRIAAELTGLDQKRINVHTQFLGGGFGRRGDTDFVKEALEVACVVPVPVQLVWTRQDDIRHDLFRPANYVSMNSGLNAKGFPIAWWQRVVGPSLALDGIRIPYDIANVRVECIEQDSGVPIGAWRSVGASQNAFSIECFIDELAYITGNDPIEYRLKLLSRYPRYRRVISLAAARAGWGKSLPSGQAMGFAFYECFKSAVAQIAIVSISENHSIRVHRVVCAIDCGIRINPDEVVAQIEGGITFGLSAALKEEITIKAGSIEQSTFKDYPILNFDETPTIDVAIVPSDRPPGGVGEPAVPPVAPAVANAVFAATGERLRSLPLRLRGHPERNT